MPLQIILNTINIYSIFTIQGEVKMNTNVYEMRMPSKYCELTEKEMEYDGGVINWVGSLAIIAAGATLTVAGKVTDNKTLKHAGMAMTVVGIISTGIGIYTLATTTCTTTMMVSTGALLTDLFAGVPITLITNSF
jgi:hypothetical protein